MKEDMFDVLIYLFENYLENEIEAFEDVDAIATELVHAGFNQPDVTKAFDWLESLSDENLIIAAAPSTFRIFCDQERAVLDLDCRNFLMFLEHSKILTSDHREIVIDRAMALKNENITLEKLKWLILMVLLSQPGETNALAQMEDIVYENLPSFLH